MNIYEQQARNRSMTLFIMAVFVLLFLAIGVGFDYFYLNFGPGYSRSGEAHSYNYDPFKSSASYYDAGDVPPKTQSVPYATILSLLIGGGMALNGLFNGRGMVLRSTMARRADPADIKEKQYLNVVAEMATAAGIKPPDAYVVPDDDLNAFATGANPENSAVAVTQGLLNSLNREELQGVVAHEMSHIRNYDMRLMTVSAALIGAIGLISDFSMRSMRHRSHSSGGGGGSDRRGKGGAAGLLLFALWLLLIILAPLLSRILAMAISREREYLADASGAELTRNPLSLISALEKIRNAVHPTKVINNGVAHMCIADPRGSLIEEKTGFVADLFATHPPMEKRILALKVMSYQSANPQA